MSRRPATAIIQARMGSSRLPGKVMLKIAEKPMLEHVIERTRLASTIGQVVVATTSDRMDDPIVEFCEARAYPYYRGSMFDVLDRYIQAARLFGAETVVRITSDCPLIDPSIIDRTVHAYFGKTEPEDFLLTSAGISPIEPAGLQPVDFAANRLPPPWGRTYPIGLDTEVCTIESLETAWLEAKEKHQREHVMPFFYDHLERFRVLLVNHTRDFGKLRWTVDTPADLELVRQIFSYFPDRGNFSWIEILELFERHSELASINRDVPAKNYRQIDERLN
jgi:spore coat polysaccharide biosynthesis protein SpsF